MKSIFNVFSLEILRTIRIQVQCLCEIFPYMHYVCARAYLCMCELGGGGNSVKLSALYKCVNWKQMKNETKAGFSVVLKHGFELRDIKNTGMNNNGISVNKKVF